MLALHQPKSALGSGSSSNQAVSTTWEECEEEKRQGPTFSTDFTGLIHLKPSIEGPQQHHFHVHGIKLEGLAACLLRSLFLLQLIMQEQLLLPAGYDAAVFASIFKS